MPSSPHVGPLQHAEPRFPVWRVLFWVSVWMPIATCIFFVQSWRAFDVFGASTMAVGTTGVAASRMLVPGVVTMAAVLALCTSTASSGAALRFRPRTLAVAAATTVASHVWALTVSLATTALLANVLLHQRLEGLWQWVDMGDILAGILGIAVLIPFAILVGIRASRIVKERNLGTLRAAVLGWVLWTLVSGLLGAIFAVGKLVFSMVFL